MSAANASGDAGGARSASDVRIGIDLGGTKIEALAIDAHGRELLRRRVASPSHDYARVLNAIGALLADVEAALGVRGARVGIGTPGAISTVTGCIKNANSTQLNGRPFAADIARVLGRDVRIENDANCFALSEAIDGAGAGHRAVFGVILGTGVGGGLVIDGRLWIGANAIAGEWGHNEMPARTEPDLPDTRCYCGRQRCIETYISGPALAADHAHATGGDGALDAAAIAMQARAGDVHAQATLARWAHRVASALSVVVNVFDPDVIVLGGGLSNLADVHADLTRRLPEQVFSDRCDTRVLPNRHGDSSGVRGAAWLWPA